MRCKKLYTTLILKGNGNENVPGRAKRQMQRDKSAKQKCRRVNGKRGTGYEDKKSGQCTFGAA